LEQGVNLFLGALGKYLHVSVLGVFYPTRKTKPPGLMAGGIPETHPLDPALDEGKKRGRTRRTLSNHKKNPKMTLPALKAEYELPFKQRGFPQTSAFWNAALN
jgi:hypothetical protein